jgi:hypothetical protein
VFGCLSFQINAVLKRLELERLWAWNVALKRLELDTPSAND